MEKRLFGNTDMQVTLLGFGGAEIGYEGAAQETVTELLNAALDAGLNVIDTAECYVNSEEMIGKAVSSRRGEFHLFTKVGHYDPSGKGGWNKESIAGSIERSLKLLKTSVLDLVQLHSCSLEELKKGDVIQALQAARDRGQTRYIGYSGDSDAARYAVECGAFDTLQTSINIADQEAIELTLPLASKRKMGVIAKRPIANTAWKYTSRPSENYHVPYWERLAKLQYPFTAGEINDAVSTAMRFTASQPGVHTMIVGTKQPGRWRSNAALLEAGALPTDQIGAIRSRWSEVADDSWVGQT
ncbi:MAG: aldo/keto reductase [Candidatus Sumerlaeaceae bacterium]